MRVTGNCWAAIRHAPAPGWRRTAPRFIGSDGRADTGRTRLDRATADRGVGRRADPPYVESRRSACRPDRRVGRCSRHRSEEHTSELQSLMRISYAVFCLKKQNKTKYLEKSQ